MEFFMMIYTLKNDKETIEMVKVSYAFDVDSLMYAQVCTRPNITFVML